MISNQLCGANSERTSSCGMVAFSNLALNLIPTESSTSCSCSQRYSRELRPPGKRHVNVTESVQAQNYVMRRRSGIGVFRWFFPTASNLPSYLHSSLALLLGSVRVSLASVCEMLRGRLTSANLSRQSIRPCQRPPHTGPDHC